MGNKKKISILIPTFNRSKYLLRLLNFIYFELKRHKLLNFFEVVVSNNGSTDQTKEMIDNIKFEGLKFITFNQTSNVGFDKNIEFLYSKASHDYVWYFADDDIIFENSIKEIFVNLNSYDPSVLLYSFQQPQGSSKKTFEFIETIKYLKQKKDIINAITKFPKLSIYIFRKINDINLNQLNFECNSKDYFFVYLCLTVNELSFNKSVLVINKFLASCDENYNQVRFTARSYLNYYKIFFHPYISKDYPEMYINHKKQCYVEAIHFMYSIISSKFTISNTSKFIIDVKNLEFYYFLFFRPKTLIKYLIIKTKVLFNL